MSQSSSPNAGATAKPVKDATAPFSRADINKGDESKDAAAAPQADNATAKPAAAAAATPAPGAGAAKKPAGAGAGARAAGPGGKPAGRPNPQTPETRPRPPVQTAAFERRHVVLALSFLLLVVLPTAISAWYLWTRAEDQYLSTIGFSVRKEDSAPTLDVLGGLTQITGNSSASDTDILYDFLRSEDIVSRIDAAVDLRGKFSKEWPNDPVFAYNPEGTIEDLTEHWQRRVKVLYDTTTQLITLRVSAYSAEDALEIAQATFEESSRTINRLSDIARDDATRFGREELIKAQERLTETRQALTAFRMETKIVDPAADLAGQMGILNTLQATLAEALIELDTLRENASESDQRVIQAEKRISAIRERINEERSKFGTNDGPGGESYAQLVAEYERLASDLEFDRTAYLSAQASYDVAVAEARRQSRYLAAHIEPKLAEASLVPDRPKLLLIVFCSLLLGWSVLLLIYYSVRDRR
ncbi:capsule biosynthesis protein [Paracoccus sp. M683]|uniref:capsule biosynthesis protein n=1 Tax=Paracoccus sp. M683 TaxID=2594268 RepID=UPI001180B3E4|nr:capsule biosynthesis protein [Paracoccus sp. M683]TRW98711.1 capsule biosynthesis protein [Paracoccus sp. M683]